MIGKIEKAQPSQSKKTLSVLIGEVWYTTKNWELQGMIGQEIVFEPSATEFPQGSGQYIQWLNDYVLSNAAHTPAAQAMDAALATAPPQTGPAAGSAAPQAAPAPKVDRDASIVAQALTKAVNCQSAEEAWRSYVNLYNRYLEWNPGDFDDDIPF